MEIKNKNYSLILSDKTGNILSFKDNLEHEYVEVETPLITISLLDGTGERINVSSKEFKNIRRYDDRVEIDYVSLGGFDIDATAFISYDESNLCRMRLKITNNSNLRLECSLYPGLTIKNDLGINDYKLFWPAMEGVEITDVNFRTELMSHADYTIYPAKGWQGVYPGACPMQFMAYYNEVKGIYLASHDENSRVKLIEWKPENNGIRLINQVYIDEESNEFEYDYDVVFGTFDGNWYDAASIYRNWLYDSKILNFKKLKENDELPKWLLEPLTVITFPVRGYKDTGPFEPNEFYPYDNCLPHVKKYQDYFGNRQMVLLMHWEGTAPWAPPYVWPPYGSKEAFDKLEKGIHDAGNLFGLYCSGLGWTQKALYYDYDRTEDFIRLGYERIVQRGPKLKLEPTTTCFHIRTGYELCPTCDETKAITKGEAKGIANETNVDYLQFFDQDLGGNTYPCYSKDHGHVSIPGRWMADSMRENAEIMKEEFKKANPNKKMLIGCEAAACEPLLDTFRFNDIRYNLDLMYGRPVPAYHFCFSEYVMNFMGNHTTATRLMDMRKHRDNIFYRTGYSFLQGDILTFMLKKDGKVNWEWNIEWDDDNEPDQEEYLRFSKMLNDLRNNELKDILRYGKMQKPLNIICGKYIERVDRNNLLRILPDIMTTRYTYEGKDVQIFVNFNSSVKKFIIENAKGDLFYDSKNVKRLSSTNEIIEMAPHSAIYLIINND